MPTVTSRKVRDSRRRAARGADTFGKLCRHRCLAEDEDLRGSRAALMWVLLLLVRLFSVVPVGFGLSPMSTARRAGSSRRSLERRAINAGSGSSNE
jgi:hypothetical protein